METLDEPADRGGSAAYSATEQNASRREGRTPETAGPGFRLTSVRIRNFRCIKELTLDLGETTVLIGENNSGKTAVLKAIELCLDRLRGPSSRVFEEYDYHLVDEAASAEKANPIEIELRLGETAPDTLPVELREELADVLVLREDGRRETTLQVTSAYDADRTEFITEGVFLDDAENPMKPAAAVHMAALRRTAPVHFLSALRDAGKHFASRGPFWREFLAAKDLSQADREDFEKELGELNQRLIEAHPPLSEVRDHLKRAQEVIVFGAGDPVTVDALPARASMLLSQARVNMASRQGAKIPLDRQGEGAQSLAVLLLFDAYLRRRLGEGGDAVVPITILEEPEAHLHPAAVRLLLDAVQRFPGQKILSTHSGDLLCGLDPESVRRLVYRDSAVRTYRAELGSLDEKNRQTFQRKIRRGRGDLLFARCWLVYEGETEAVLFSGVAEALGIDLDRHGIAHMQCSDINLASLIRIANQFGIPWYLVYDGDKGRNKYERAAMENLEGAAEEDRYLCPYPNIEEFLKENGFDDLYNKKDFNKVTTATRATKRMLEEPATVPEALKRILEKTVSLAAA